MALTSQPAEAMNRIQQRYYERDFRIAFLESDEHGFRSLFGKLMSKAHPNNFIACKPCGNAAKWKNDGYLFSTRVQENHFSGL